MKKIIFALFLLLAFSFFTAFDSQLKSISGKDENDLLHSLSESSPVYWARTYGGGNKEDIRGNFSFEETSDGGYIVAGTTNSFGEGGNDCWVVKLTPEGNIEWQRAYGGSGDNDNYGSILETQDGGYIFSGFTNSFGAGFEDLWVLKLTSSGNIQWQKTYGGSESDFGWNIQETSDGGYVVAGITESFGAGSRDIWILKLTSSGNIQWQKTYGGSHEEEIEVILPTEDGGYIVGANTWSFGVGVEDFWVLKLSSSGEIEWQKTYGGNVVEAADYIKQTRNGGYIVGGRTESFGVGGADAWILKLTPSGHIEWQRAYGGSGDWDNCGPIHETQDGGYIFAGGTNSFLDGSFVVPTETHDIWILKLTSEGDIEWQKTYGGNDWDFSCSIQEASGGGYIYAGGTASFGAGSYDILIMKLSPGGEIGPSCGFIGNMNASVTETSVSPSDTNITPMDTNVTPQSSSASPQDTDANVELLCWNLNQPPVGLSYQREANRSLFRSEVLHTISWESNPLNSQYIIEEYRIYRGDPRDYELIGSVSGSASEYIDRVSDITQTFLYAVTSVDSDGHESPKSPWVGEE